MKKIISFFIFVLFCTIFISNNAYAANKTVKVKFDYQNGSAVASKVVKYDTTIPEPELPERAGYTFLRWTKDPGGEFEWYFDEPITWNITLYAQWHKIDYIYVGVETKKGTNVDPIRVKYNGLLPMPSATPSKIGYTFVGWYKDYDGFIKWNFKKDRVTQDTTLYAKWRKGVADANVIWKDMFDHGLISDVEVNAYFTLPLTYNLVVGEDVIITSSNPEIIKVSPLGCIDFISYGTADLTIYLPASKSSSTKTFNVVEKSEFDKSFSDWFLMGKHADIISFGRHYYGNDYKSEHQEHYYYYDRIDEKEVIVLDIGDVGMSHIKSYYDDISYEYGVDYKLVSSDPSVVVVNKNGSVKCLSPGRAVITITKLSSIGPRQQEAKQTIDVLDYSDQHYTTQITQAYKDPSYKKYLSKKSLAVLNKAKSVIATEIKPDMTNLQKEKAIHDYIVLNTTYGSYKKVTNTTPYSCLIYGKANCQGYAQTFAMFMTMLDIPNTYVSGSAGGEGHTWNRVKIGKVWYNVDTTWDDPLPDVGKVSNKYFNISDKIMSKDHSWRDSGDTLPASINVY